MRLMFISLSFLLFISAAALDEPDVKAIEEYCDMIALYSVSQGEAGWPAYQGTEMCSHE